MATAARYGSPYNYFLPIPTGQVIQYVRDPSEFKLNRYVQLVDCPAPTGTYWELDRDQPVRVVTDAEFAFEDGDKRPEGNTNLSNFIMTEFKCNRRAIPFTLGEETVELAKKHGAWDPITVESKSCVSQAMTLRTKQVITALETAGNWGTHTDTATNLGGGRWDAGSSTAPYLKRGLLAAAQAINLQTNGMAKLSDLRLILAPADAIDISASQEIHDYVRNNEVALRNITQTLGNPNELWGLPSHLYGIEVIVENSPYVSTRPTAAATTTGGGTRAFQKTTASAILVYRPGGLSGAYGTKSFSTVQLFYYKYEMAVEMMHDTWNKRHMGSVIDWYAAKVVAWPTGYLITSITT